MGCHFLLQGIFPAQGSNLGLPHCRQTLYRLSHQSTVSSLSRPLLSKKRRDSHLYHMRELPKRSTERRELPSSLASFNDKFPIILCWYPDSMWHNPLKNLTAIFWSLKSLRLISASQLEKSGHKRQTQNNSRARKRRSSYIIKFIHLGTLQIFNYVK